MSKKSYLYALLSLFFLLAGCDDKNAEHEGFGPSPADGKSRTEEPNEGFGPSPIDG